jgi:hypothetical protein
MTGVKDGRISRIETNHCIDILVSAEERDKIQDRTIRSHVNWYCGDHFGSAISSINLCPINWKKI